MKDCKLSYKLLNHPFYQSWNEGTITTDQLSKYGQSYLEFIKNMPVYWGKALKDLGAVDENGERVVSEETDHIALWEKWIMELPKTESYPVMTELLDSFKELEGSELLGALHAFEVQQPEVARTKKEGLIKHYGFKAENLNYFDEHLEEEHHIRYALDVQNKYGDDAKFQEGFSKGQKLVYQALDKFVNCVN